MDDKIEFTHKLYEIMVIEDDPICLLLLSKLFKGAGYQVRLAENADIALKSIKEKLPTLILLDVIMPGMNGYDLCKILKADKYTSTIPVIFCSGLTEDNDKAKGFAAGGIDYLTKPYDLLVILDRIQTHLKVIWEQSKFESEQVIKKF